MSVVAPGTTILAYFHGLIFNAILVHHLAGLPNPHGSGSGSPGATDVLCIGNKGAVVAVLILDILRDMLPI